MTALNNWGAMVGSRWQDGLSKAFFTKPITFIDSMGEPWLALLDGTTLTSQPFMLARRGRPVQAIAADGASQILIRIPVATIGESVTVSIYKTKTQQANNGEVSEYGIVGVPGSVCPGTGCEFPQVTVSAQDTYGLGPMAFVVYRAPLDFARSPADANSPLAISIFASRDPQDPPRFHSK